MQTIYVNIQCRPYANKECYSCRIICDWLIYSFPGILIVITGITLNLSGISFLYLFYQLYY